MQRARSYDKYEGFFSNIAERDECQAFLRPNNSCTERNMNAKSSPRPVAPWRLAEELID